MKDYAAKPWHSSPGAHDIYYTDLRQLTDIIRANSHLFVPAIPDIDHWIARLEMIRIPRNIVGHMNFPSTSDAQRINVLESDLRALMPVVQAAGVKLIIP